MTTQNTQAVIAAFKNLLRVGLAAVLPILIQQLSMGHVDLVSVGTAGLIAVLVGLDTLIHKSDLPANGLMSQIIQ